MKLYTEEQVKKAIKLSLLNAKLFIHKGLGDDKYFPTVYEALKNLTPIELPSDEEIAYEAITWKVFNMEQIEAFKYGVKWAKEQILNQNK